MSDVAPLLARALQAASDTRWLAIAPDALRQVPAVFQKAFPGQPRALVVADRNTFRAAGERVVAALRSAGIDCSTHVLNEPTLIAEWRHVDALDELFRGTDATPVAVGAGTINDLVKLSAHHAGRQYLCVATAGSMDGYTAYASSVTKNGSKQTFDCPAPRAVVADLDVIAAAPAWLNAAGYGDLLAKVPAGADWILADALGVEPIEAAAWELVQMHLRRWCEDAVGIPAGDPAAIRGLVEGLMMTGFAMQGHKSSRPASGAEHQFSHVWDMQHHTHDGRVVPHGFKVAIGSVAMTALYEWVLQRDVRALDIDAAAAQWPVNADEAAAQARAAYDSGDMARKAEIETRAKYVPRDALRRQLAALKGVWTTLVERLRRQLISLARLREMLAAAGTPSDAAQIGITADRLRRSHWQAYFIRRRFTVLDLAVRCGWLGSYVGRT